MEEKEININDLVDSIDDTDADIPENSKVEYEIWVVGDDANGCAIDFEKMLDDGYTEESEARKCYDFFSDSENLKIVFETKRISIPDNVAHTYLRLEAVIEEGPDMMLCNDIVEECEVKIK